MIIDGSIRWLIYSLLGLFTAADSNILETRKVVYPRLGCSAVHALHWLMTAPMISVVTELSSIVWSLNKPGCI